MKRDDDPPEDKPRCEPGKSLLMRWPEALAREDLRRWRDNSGATDGWSLSAREQWIDTFTEHYNREVMHAVSAYAVKLLSQGGAVPPHADHAHTLAHEALVDTIEGRRRWDADDKERPLRRHLLDVVKRRIYAAWERAQERPHVSIDQPDVHGAPSARVEMERTLRERAPDPRDAENARDFVAELLQRAADDPDVMTLIRARITRESERADAIAVTGWSPQRYRAALRRFGQIAKGIRDEWNLTPNGKELLS